MKKAILIFCGVMVSLLIIACLIPVDTSSTNSIKVSGTVKNVTEAGVKDLVFELENDPTTYYINRGLENGVPLATAKKLFEGKKIKLFYADSWTPLAPFGTKGKHITHVAVNDSVIFSEW